MRVAFHTLGCKLNQSESEALASSFRKRGFFIARHDTREDESADIFIVNTCTVTSKAEQKARRLIRRLSRNNPLAVIVVTGCYAQMDPSDLSNLAPNVLVIGHERKYRLLELAECLERNGGCSTEASASAVMEAAKACVGGYAGDAAERGGIFRFAADTYSFHSRAFLKIQDGCNHQCSYCRVRLARGPSVSLDPEEVETRVSELAGHGYREIVLTGVNITAYRSPMDHSYLLADLVRDLTGGEEDFRIRLSSLEPEMISPRLLEAVAHPRVCPHFHIPVQSGSDRILRSVKRPYTVDRVRRAIDGLRKAKDDPFLAADVIVGLPGETEEDFEATRSLIVEGRFAALHVFPFSPRPGTELYHATQHVPERIAGQRAENLRELAEGLHDAYAGGWLGRTVEVLPEAKSSCEDRVCWEGLSENYLRVFFPEDVSKHLSAGTAPGEGEAARGKPVPVRIEKIEKKAGRITGRMVSWGRAF
jgi:threonylcarbamoyladenosine tRNA methylthiotransferase MtaB